MYKPPYKSGISTDKGQSVVSFINKQTPVTSAGCSKSQIIQDDRNAMATKKVSKIKKSATKKGSKSTKSETELKANPSKQSIFPPKPVRPVSAFFITFKSTCQYLLSRETKMELPKQAQCGGHCLRLKKMRLSLNSKTPS